MLSVFVLFNSSNNNFSWFSHMTCCPVIVMQSALELFKTWMTETVLVLHLIGVFWLHNLRMRAALTTQLCGSAAESEPVARSQRGGATWVDTTPHTNRKWSDPAPTDRLTDSPCGTDGYRLQPGASPWPRPAAPPAAAAGGRWWWRPAEPRAATEPGPEERHRVVRHLDQV